MWIGIRMTAPEESADLTNIKYCHLAPFQNSVVKELSRMPRIPSKTSKLKEVCTCTYHLICLIRNEVVIFSIWYVSLCRIDGGGDSNIFTPKSFFPPHENRL